MDSGGSLIFNVLVLHEICYCKYLRVLICNKEKCDFKSILLFDSSSYLSSSSSSGSGKRETAKSHPNHSDTLRTNSWNKINCSVLYLIWDIIKYMILNEIISRYNYMYIPHMLLFEKLASPRSNHRSQQSLIFQTREKSQLLKH